MALTLGDNFSYQGAKPLDARQKYDTVAVMKTVADSTMYDGCLAYCKETDKTYQWKSTNTADSTLGKWREFESGGGGGGTSAGITIDATLLANGWDANNQQTLVFSGYTTDLGGVIGMPASATDAQKTAYSEAIIDVVSQSGASIVFKCENVPSINLPVTLYAGGGSGGGGTAEFPAGGTTGQALVKASDADNDVEWGDVSGEQVQYDTMPAPSADNLNQIVQYTGETTSTAPIYVNGLFYKCIEDPDNAGSYIWEQRDVQSYPETDLTNVFASGFPVASVSGDRRFNYQTDEHEVGTWIDGSIIYQKTISCGVLPNASNKNIAHGITNLNRIILINGYAYAPSINMFLPIPFVDTGNAIYSVRVAVIGSNIVIDAGADRSNCTESYVTLQYTKTTD